MPEVAVTRRQFNINAPLRSAHAKKMVTPVKPIALTGVISYIPAHIDTYLSYGFPHEHDLKKARADFNSYGLNDPSKSGLYGRDDLKLWRNDGGAVRRSVRLGR